MREGTALALREFVSSDAYALAEILGDPHVMRHTSTGAMSYEATVDLMGVAEADQADPGRTRHRLAIVQREGGALVGTVTVEREQYSSVYCHSIILRPHLADLSAGYETSQLVASLAFDVLGVHRLWFMTAVDNLAAQRLFLASGSTRDGKVRELYFRDGRWWDCYMFTILEHEWRARAHLTLREALTLLRRKEQEPQTFEPALG
ncbi:GNAT family N-acetyltransferase [Streptomyces sp. AN091965]|uniref:GNAT family N-acetyltransferase n=1 Tax=Streptomyces sp. AN091965 TaxID=2927803 RepID=UPI001F610862|nr:GNAT family protein [Streptomyces sp. AN091965]MCI3935503.1 GNAT family N-acetyltransferase [Streptomyces sp. AN091965]